LAEGRITRTPEAKTCTQSNLDSYLMILDEGREKGAREDILLFGEEMFGPADASARAQLEAVTDLDRLKRIVCRAAKAGNWQEILDTP
jgi:hypothetical protein